MPVRPVWLPALLLTGCFAAHSPEKHAQDGDPASLDAGQMTTADAGLPADASEPQAPDAARQDAAAGDATAPDAAPPEPVRACADATDCELDDLFRYERATVLQGVSLVDIDEDGLADVLSSYHDARGVQLELMLPDHTLAPARTIPSGSPEMAHVVGDFSADGHVDFAVVTNQGKDLSVFAGDGHGGFTRELVSSGFDNPIWALGAGRIDGDASDDLVLITGNPLTPGQVQMRTILFSPAALITAPVALPNYGGDSPRVLQSGAQRVVLAIAQGFWLWSIAADGSLGSPHQLDDFADIVAADVADLNGDKFPDLFAQLKNSPAPASVPRIGVWYGSADGFARTPVITEVPGLHNSFWMRLTVQDHDGDGRAELLGLFADGVKRLSDEGSGSLQLSPVLGVLPNWRQGARLSSARSGDEVIIASRASKELARIGQQIVPLYTDEADPASLVVTDFTHDGRVDLVTLPTYPDLSLSLFENGEQGIAWPRTLQPFPDDGSEYGDPVAADVAGDGRSELLLLAAGCSPDLAQVDESTLVRHAFGGNVYGCPKGLSAFDLDHDGSDDAVEQFEQAIALWLRGPDGVLAPRMREIVYTPNPYENQRNLPGVAPIMVDLDHDLERELLVPRTPGLWWLEHDAGELAVRGDLALDLVPTRLGVMDLDGDGEDDVLMLANHYQKPDTAMYWLRANGHGLEAAQKLALESADEVVSFVVADVGGDATPELIVLDSGNTLGMYQRTAGARFTRQQAMLIEARDVALSPVTYANVLSADFTGDGQSEVVVHLTNSNSRLIVVLENRTRP